MQFKSNHTRNVKVYNKKWNGNQLAPSNRLVLLADLPHCSSNSCKCFFTPPPSLSLSTLSVPFYLSGTISFSSSLASSRCPSISFRLELSFSCTLSPLSLLPLCPFSRLDSLNLISWVGLITAIQQIQIVKYSKTRSLSLPQKSRANDLNIGI